jgi:DNA-binding LacI/PurR family transcriptional regulator
MLLGVIVREITDPFFAGAIEAVSIEASRLGYNVVLGHAHGRTDEALELWGVLEARHCDAIMLLGDLRDHPGLIEDLQETRVPVVALWHGSHTTGIPTVSVDNRAGIWAIMDHLAGLGHRRIAFAGRRRLGDIQEREAAYLAYLGQLGEPARKGYVQHVVNDFEGGVQAFRRMARLREAPTALVAATDVIAIGALHAAQRAGWRVPEDVSISGFDDIPVAAVSVPALTTARMPVSDMVRLGVRMAIGETRPAVGQPEGEGSMERHPVLQPSLVVRASTGPAPGEGGRATA